MTSETQAIVDWMQTQEYKEGVNAQSIGCPEINRQYLQNRLMLAFHAGMDAGKSIEQERIIEQIRKALK